METIILIIMLLMGNADFEKGKTVELDISGESESIVLTYQDDNWITVRIREKRQSDLNQMSVLLADKFITFNMQGQLHKMTKDDFLKQFEVKSVNDGTGYDYVTKMIRISNGEREETRNEAKMRFERNGIVVTSQGKTTTYGIKENHNKPDAGNGK